MQEQHHEGYMSYLNPLSDEELKELLTEYEQEMRAGVGVSDAGLKQPDFAIIIESAASVWTTERWQELRREGGARYQRALDLLLYTLSMCRYMNRFDVDKFFEGLDFLEALAARVEMEKTFEVDEQRRAQLAAEARAEQETEKRNQDAADTFAELMSSSQDDVDVEGFNSQERGNIAE